MSGGDDAPAALHPAVLISVAAMGGFLFGYDTAIVNGGLFQMRRSFGFSSDSWIAGLIVSSAIAGAVIGALAGGFLSNRYGRKTAISIADVSFAIGAVVIAAAPDIPVVVVGRVILGFGVGTASIVVPVYLAEVTPASIRGAAIAANNFSITGAQFLAAIVAVAFVYTESDEERNPWGWRCMFGIAAIPAIAQLLLLRIVPESPSWMKMVGKPEAEVFAAKGRCGMLTQAALLERHDIDDSHAAIHNSAAALVNEDNVVEQGGASLLELLRTRAMYRRVLIAVALQAFQQLAGINTVMYYSATILHHAGFTGERAPVLFSVPLAGTNALFTIVGVWAVERFGRRPLILTSLAACAVATAAFALVAFLYPGDHPPRGASYGFIFCLIAYLACFAPGMGPVPWVVSGELFPLRYRSAAASVATTANWASNAAVSQAFPVLMGWAGTGPTFTIIVGVCIVAFVVIALVLPETRGVPLDDMEADLPRVPPLCGA